MVNPRSRSRNPKKKQRRDESGWSSVHKTIRFKRAVLAEVERAGEALGFSRNRMVNHVMEEFVESGKAAQIIKSANGGKSGLFD